MSGARDFLSGMLVVFGWLMLGWTVIIQATSRVQLDPRGLAVMYGTGLASVTLGAALMGWL